MKQARSRMGLTFNQTTAIFGVFYAGVLFFYFRKLKMVWQREAARARYGKVLFTILFVLSIGSFSYVYWVRLAQHYATKRPI